MSEIKIIAANRQFISLLLSLLLVISGPVLAVSEMTGGQADTPTVDCGSMVNGQVENTSHPSGAGSDCFTASDMDCLSAGGLSQCGVSFAILPSDSTGLTDIGSQPGFIGHIAIYQDPFLGSSTPPPLRHS